MSERRIVIVGAGLIGASCALALARQGYAVTLVDRAAPSLERGELGVDIRNVALNPQSQLLLEELNVWPERVAPYDRMHVWEEFGQGRIEFDAISAGVKQLGWLVEASPLQCDLWDACSQCMDVQIGEVTEVTHSAEKVSLKVGDRRIEADLLIAADGGRSLVRTSLGGELDRLAESQFALATVLRTELPHADVARQRFLSDGPLALLPGPQSNLVSVVWSQSKEQAQLHSELPHDEFCVLIEHASESVLGSVLQADKRLVFPLSQQWSRPDWNLSRVLYIGDALRVVHPLAGLGANLGFEDVRALKSDIAGILASPGESRQYARRRYARSVEVARLLAALKWGYAQSGPWQMVARNLGVRAIEKSPLIKRQIMREAMGLAPLSKVAVGSS